MKMYQKLSTALTARDNCIDSKNLKWEETWTNKINAIMKLAPDGSGFDAGTEIEKFDRNKIVFSTSYHHMNNLGYYTGWTEHTIVISPDWQGIHLKVTGRNTNNIKEYIADAFHSWLFEDVKE